MLLGLNYMTGRPLSRTILSDNNLNFTLILFGLHCQHECKEKTYKTKKKNFHGQKHADKWVPNITVISQDLLPTA